jgi:lipoprotein-releasing system ATP-binding protein
MNNSPIIECRGVVKTYRSGPAPVAVLNGLDLQVVSGESIAILGASGSGKSTLLHCLGGLDSVDAGDIRIQGESWADCKDKDRQRNQNLGFIYQFHHLIAELSALDNVALPLRIRRVSVQEARAAALALLQRVGLDKRAEHLPSELSGGERQRVAIARALVSQPKALLADEPTGNLDADNARNVMQILLACTQEQGAALILVTHATELAGLCQKQYHLQSGRLAP